MKLTNEEIEEELSWARDMMKLKEVVPMLDAPPYLIEPEYQNLLGVADELLKNFFKSKG
jgi:hypothetical protein